MIVCRFFSPNHKATHLLIFKTHENSHHTWFHKRCIHFPSYIPPLYEIYTMILLSQKQLLRNGTPLSGIYTIPYIHKFMTPTLGPLNIPHRAIPETRLRHFRDIICDKTLIINKLIKNKKSANKCDISYECTGASFTLHLTIVYCIVAIKILGLHTKKVNKHLFEDDKKHAAQAIRDAQFIAFAPYVFQASVILRDSGILKYIEGSRLEGRSIQEVADTVKLPYYGVRVLMEAALGIGLLYRKDARFFLAKTGHVFINHPMARINTDFMRDVCYDGAADLAASIADGKPRGLKHLGGGETIYEGLSGMAEPAKSSWFAFDHYYSDLAFPEVLPFVFGHAPVRILDIGANTGKWAIACMAYDINVSLGLLDLGGQLAEAKKNIEAAGYSDRVTYHAHDILDNKTALPAGYDLIFMSQFLNCFTDKQIIAILKKCHDVLPDEGRIIINETFWNCQQYEAGAFSLQMASLYFTTMANGNSQMYDSEVYLKVIDETGFEVVSQHDHIGLSHSILELKKKKFSDGN